jgi:ribose/xylose/arabinose/galactoside ABC-type transport system permease subunit
MRDRIPPSARPFILLAGIVAVLALLDAGQGRFLNVATAFSVLQQFATIGPMALALGLSMIVREFDLSVGGMLSLAGCLAILAGVDAPLVGVLVAVLAGGASGLLQGLIMVGLRLDSVGVTLGGLLTLGGLTYVLTGNATIGYERMDVAMLVSKPLLGIFSIRNLVAIAAFAIAAVLMAWTRVGRDVVATGSDRRAARIAGVGVDHILIGVFVVSGMLTGLSGALLSYSLGAASPVALADALVPAAAAAIIGGVSLSGGKGTPLGIAGGVLVLAVLRSGLTAIGVPPFVHDIVTGGVLLAVALLDADDLQRRLYGLLGLVRAAPTPQTDGDRAR